ncbi:MAG TPA: type II secretion system protein GspH [Gammaproteobacteria bacterium]|nr:type II secretion system protein GspH [Gammaproteobacteria bacterium]
MSVRLLSARPGRSAGFTLLELMVVLVLIGIIFSFAVLSLRGTDISDLMEQETRRLATLLELASDEAILQGEELAVNFEDDGYEFLVLQGNSWQSSIDDGLLKAYSMPAEVELRLEVEGEPPELNKFAAQEDGDSEEDEEEEEDLTPQVFILSSGEMTPFTVTFMSFQSDYRYHLTVSLLGKVSWEVEETL